MLARLSKYSFCDFSRSTGLAPSFQILIAHFDQNGTINYQLNAGF